VPKFCASPIEAPTCKPSLCLHRALQGEHRSRPRERWEERGFEGLLDGRAPGNPPRITQEARTFIEGKLSEERTWNATQLAQALGESFGVEVTPEAIRQHLHSMGYSWKRTRYVPSKPPDPDEEREAREELEALKKGLEKESSS
jgi:transposase